MPDITYYSKATKSMFPAMTLQWASMKDLAEIVGDFEVVKVDMKNVEALVTEKKVTFAEAYAEHLDALKVEYPCIAGCSLIEKKPRKIGNVIENSIAVLDVDDAGAFEKIEPLVQALGVGYVCYTSFKSRLDHLKLRYIFPLAQCVSRREWAILWSGMNNYFKGLIDQKCKDPTRLYFLPIRPSVVAAAEHFIEVHEGPLLDMGTFRAYAKDAMVGGSTRILGAYGERAIHDEGEVLRECTIDELRDLASALKKKRGSAALVELGTQMMKGLDGKAFGEHGERNDTMFKIAAIIADIHPDLEPESVERWFADSIELMRAQGSKLKAGQMAGRYEEQAAKVREKKRMEAGAEADLLASRIATAIPGRTAPYSAAELDGFKEMGHNDKQWIVQMGTGNGYYFFVDGTYSHPVGGEAMMTHAETMLSPAISAGVQLHAFAADGTPQLRNRQTLMSEYGSVAEKVFVDLTAQRSTYNAKSKTFVEATCPLREIEPKYDELIDEYFATICGGRNKSYEHLLDWCSVVTFLARPLSCLYFGNCMPNSGKSLLANGIARLWSTGGPTKMAAAVASFNDAITGQPLIHGDEHLPPSMLKNGTGPLREFIQNVDWTLNRKYIASAPTKGALRVMFTANNDGMLDSAGEAESLTAHDIDGIRQRFLYITMDPAAVTFLDEIGGRPWINPRWIEQDGLAAHVLALRQQRGFDLVNTKERFMVCGGTEKLVSNMSINTGLRGNVCHALVAAIMGGVRTTKESQIRVVDGRVLATPQGVLDAWGHALNDQRIPSLTRVAQALEGLSLRSVDMGDWRFFEVSQILLRAWADKMHYCTLEALDRNMQGK